VSMETQRYELYLRWSVCRHALAPPPTHPLRWVPVRLRCRRAARVRARHAAQIETLGGSASQHVVALFVQLYRVPALTIASPTAVRFWLWR